MMPNNSNPSSSARLGFFSSQMGGVVVALLICMFVFFFDAELLMEGNESRSMMIDVKQGAEGVAFAEDELALLAEAKAAAARSKMTLTEATASLSKITLTERVEEVESLAEAAAARSKMTLTEAAPSPSKTMQTERAEEAELASVAEAAAARSKITLTEAAPSPSKMTLTERVEESRSNFFAQLKADYGEDNFVNMFQETDENNNKQSRGRSIYTSMQGFSWTRLQRKFAIKILQAKLSSESKDDKTRLVWATGGHSASAGHGNFLHEAYTTVMEGTMKPIFGNLGIDFEARPFAMGGTSSAEQVALCMDQIFGEDIDILSWDFGMLEPRQREWKQLLYTYQTAMGKNRPASIGIDYYRGKRNHIETELEQLGMTVFHLNGTVDKAIQEVIPDTLEITTDAEVEQMPPLVRQFKCGTGLENGEVCGKAKYNNTFCPKRPSRVKWHPGWKQHALTGNSISLFLIEVLWDAVKDVDAVLGTKDQMALLEQYTKEEENDYKNVLSSPIPDSLSKISNRILGSETEEPKFGKISLLEFYKRKPFCHTALLPAQMRYKGLLTENFNQTGRINYEKGIKQPGKEDPVERDGGLMRLSHNPDEEHDKLCPEVGGLNIDFKDFFYLNNREGPKKVVIPNDSSKDYYGVDTSKMLGMIIVCFTTCDWGKCGNADMRDKVNDGQVKLHVNGALVKEFTPIDICWALQNEDDEYQWTPNEQGKFEIQAQVIGKDGRHSFLRFSSFILL